MTRDELKQKVHTEVENIFKTVIPRNTELDEEQVGDLEEALMGLDLRETVQEFDEAESNREPEDS